MKIKSVKVTWILTYMILFLMPVIVAVVMFFIVDGSIKDQVNKSNYFILKQIQKYMDDLVNNVENISNGLLIDNKVQDIMNMEVLESPEDRYKLYELYKDMLRRKNDNDIEDVYIYFHKIDTVVRTQNVMDSKLFFKTFCEDNDIDINSWLKINSSEYNGKYINLNSNDSMAFEESKKFIYIKSIPAINNKNVYANIVIVIDKSRLSSMFSNIKAIDKGNAAIIDSENNIILQLTRDSFSDIKYVAFHENQGINYEQINGKKSPVTYVKSSVKNWLYIYSAPTGIYYKSLLKYREFIYTGIFLCIIFSCIVSYVLFKNNYAPIKHLLKSLSLLSEKENYGDSNEYNLIKKLATRLFDKKNKISQWISFQKEVLLDKYIENLLMGRTENQLLYNERGREEINFISDSFCVMSFNIFHKDSNKYLENFKLMQFIIQNLLNELLENNGKAYTVDINGKIISLINMGNHSKNYKAYMQEISNSLQDIVRKYYYITLNIGISNVYEGTSNIAIAYKEAEEIMDLSEIVGGDEVIFYDKIQGDFQRNYEYSLEAEKNLLDAIREGDFDEAQIQIEQIFYKNFKENKLGIAMTKCLKFSLISSLIKIVNDFIDYYGEEFNCFLDPLEKLVKDNKLELKENILLVLEDLCTKVSCNNKIGSQIGNEVKIFINNNYKDENLNISQIAEAFKLHPSYISKLFKMQTGEGILDYISNIRTEEAKILLKNNEKINLEVIAKNIGYTNVRTFVRNFTKHTGVSPKQYKDI
jgi:AraC-like DNA-binding protein